MLLMQCRAAASLLPAPCESDGSVDVLGPEPPFIVIIDVSQQATNSVLCPENVYSSFLFEQDVTASVATEKFPLFEHMDVFILEKCFCCDCASHLLNVFSEYDYNKI